MAAAKRGELVHRPPKKTEYEICFATTNARKGWQDLVATIRNPMSDAWDFLTRIPLATTPTNYRLQGGFSARYLAGVPPTNAGSTSRQLGAQPESGTTSTSALSTSSRCIRTIRARRSNRPLSCRPRSDQSVGNKFRRVCPAG